MSDSEFADDAEQLRRNVAAPLWAQLETELRRRLDAGHFVDRFPTDRELMEIYGVSRHTARHAVSQLGASGIVRRSRGIGTWIDTGTFERSLGALYSLFQVVEASGLPQRSEVRALRRVLDPEVALRLGLNRDAELLHLDRLRFAGDEPLAIDRTWLPFRIAAPLLQVDFSRTALYDELDRTIGRRPTEGWERIHPAIPTEEERLALRLDERQAVFAIERLGKYDGQPLEWRTTTTRGDRFAFLADWSAGRPTDLRFQMVDARDAHHPRR